MAFHSPVLRQVTAADQPAAGSDALQPLHWTELRARLAAGQQLRQALVAADRTRHPGSFAPEAARTLAQARRAGSGTVGDRPSS